jgi:hypothetical protein
MTDYHQFDAADMARNYEEGRKAERTALIEKIKKLDRFCIDLTGVEDWNVAGANAAREQISEHLLTSLQGEEKLVAFDPNNSAHLEGFERTMNKIGDRLRAKETECCEKCGADDRTIPEIREELKKISPLGRACWMDNCPCHV